MLFWGVPHLPLFFPPVSEIQTSVQNNLFANYEKAFTRLLTDRLGKHDFMLKSAMVDFSNLIPVVQLRKTKVIPSHRKSQHTRIQNCLRGNSVSSHTVLLIPSLICRKCLQIYISIYSHSTLMHNRVTSMTVNGHKEKKQIPQNTIKYQAAH